LRKPFMVFILVFAVLASVVVYLKSEFINNYSSSIEEAAKRANIKLDVIYDEKITENRVLLIYGDNENKVFSVGLLKKNWFGYQWIMGSGFAETTKAKLPPVTIGFANLPTDNHGASNNFVSVAFGSIISNQITQLTVLFNDSDSKPAKVVETSMGRKWYVLSDKPIDKDPQIIGINNENKKIYTNY
jgi:hypothetical protein